MSLTIELLPAQEQRIQEEAERAGVSASEIVKRAIDAHFPVVNGAAKGEALMTDTEREQENRLFEQLHANMNETRQSLGMRTL